MLSIESQVIYDCMVKYDDHTLVELELALDKAKKVLNNTPQYKPALNYIPAAEKRINELKGS